MTTPDKLEEILYEMSEDCEEHTFPGQSWAKGNCKHCTAKARQLIEAHFREKRDRELEELQKRCEVQAESSRIKIFELTAQVKALTQALNKIKDVEAASVHLEEYFALKEVKNIAVAALAREEGQ